MKHHAPMDKHDNISLKKIHGTWRRAHFNNAHDITEINFSQSKTLQQAALRLSMLHLQIVTMKCARIAQLVEHYKCTRRVNSARWNMGSKPSEENILLFLFIFTHSLIINFVHV
jgi:hypothetical protein